MLSLSRPDADLVVFRTLDDVSELGEGYPVVLGYFKGEKVLCAANEGGYNCTMIKLTEVVKALQEYYTGLALLPKDSQPL